MRAIWPLLFAIPAAYLLLAGPVAIASEKAEGTPTPAFKPVVSSITFIGNNAISTGDLRDHIVTQATNWLRFWQTHRFRKREIADDMDRIAALYRLRGYYETVATHTFSSNESGARVAIEIRIDEGLPVHTDDVAITLPDGAPPFAREEIEELAWNDFMTSLALRSGERFELERYGNAREKILAFVAQRGFPLAQVNGGAEVDLVSHKVEIKWTLDLGRRIRMGPVEIEGLEDVDRYIVRREITLEPGQWYSPAAMSRTRRKLQNLGLFRWTVVEAEPPETDEERGAESSDGDIWPVYVRVAERSPRRIRLGGGWGTDTSFRGELSWHHRNFFGGARQADVALRYSGLGGAVRPSFTEPYFLGTNTRFTASTAFALDDQDAYTARRLLIDLQLDRTLIAPWSIQVGYRFDRNDIYSVVDEPGVDDPPEGIAITTGPHIGLRRSTVNDPLASSSGSYLDLRAQSSFTPLGSDEDFIRYTMDARAFGELWRTVLATRLLVGTIHNLSDTDEENIPLVERFYSGGSSSMRGFGYRSLSPEDVNGDSIGGSSLIEASIEWRIPIFENFGAVAFVDAAAVEPEAFRWELGELLYAAGPGLRYQTPAGPIRLDFAWRLNPDAKRGRMRINASLGHTF